MPVSSCSLVLLGTFGYGSNPGPESLKQRRGHMVSGRQGLKAMAVCPTDRPTLGVPVFPSRRA